jgi:hypothetical protein
MTATLERAQEFIENSAVDGWPSTVDMKVILPGLVRYSDLKNAAGELTSGDVLVTKEALDRMANSLEGKPIVNWDHRRVSPDDFRKGKAQGIIVGPAVFNSKDGWYHAKGYVWDEPTRKNIERGYSISCAYTVDEWGDGPGTLNQVPYMQEVKNGTYTHIAVVPVPRYEGARIEILNSQGGRMGLLSLFRKDKPEEKIDVPMETELTLENGAKTTLGELVKMREERETKERENLNALSDDRTFEINGKKVTLRELKNEASVKMMNAEDKEKERMDDEHKNSKHPSVPMKNCAMCNAAAEEEKKKKDEEEKKNSMAAEEKNKREAQELKNAEERKAKEEAEKNGRDLDERRNAGGKVEMPKIESINDRMAEGEKRYGILPAAGKK